MAILVTTSHSAQAIVASDITEGKFVKLSQSGQRNDVATAVQASANDVIGVYVAFMPPDNFTRPTPRSLYKAPWYRNWNVLNGNSYGNPSETETYDRIPRSMWREPTVTSGELVALHRGVIGLTSGAFHDSAAIKVQGAWVRVGASGMAQVTTTASEVIAAVRHYDAANGVLYISFEV
jgi:hypothetical protein